MLARKHPASEQICASRGWYRYLHYARSGIRVSQAEEAKGSDGTFS